MNLEVSIYISNLIKFFNDNPKDLTNLIPIEKKDEFFNKVKVIANKNVVEFQDPTLTKEQFIEVCRDIISTEEDHYIVIKKEGPLVFTKFGIISLN